MLKYFISIIGTESLVLVWVEQLCAKVLEGLRVGDSLWVRPRDTMGFHSFDVGDEIFAASKIERMDILKHLVHDDTDSPAIDTLVILFAIELLWRIVVWCSSSRGFRLTLSHGKGKTEIDELEIAVLVEHDV